ncbi:hypothetical protein COO60DRAFT_547531 [Scenedesmus sp. NREL 46B-D3]|nr:hypothetical protein COO60DRAFT_547531 [Scenedesmus sp. NREL 46B-D3]
MQARFDCHCYCPACVLHSVVCCAVPLVNWDVDAYSQVLSWGCQSAMYCCRLEVLMLMPVALMVMCHGSSCAVLSVLSHKACPGPPVHFCVALRCCLGKPCALLLRDARRGLCRGNQRAGKESSVQGNAWAVHLQHGLAVVFWHLRLASLAGNCTLGIPGVLGLHGFCVNSYYILLPRPKVEVMGAFCCWWEAHSAYQQLRACSVLAAAVD